MVNLQDIFEAMMGMAGVSGLLMMIAVMIWMVLIRRPGSTLRFPSAAAIITRALQFMIGSLLSTCLDYCRVIFDVHRPGVQFPIQVQVPVIFLASALKLLSMWALCKAITSANSNTDQDVDAVSVK